MSEAKQELVRGWLLKASHDLGAAQVLGASKKALLDVAIYHCQQAGEKALKGFLVFWDQRVEKTHDLRALLRKAMVIEPRLGVIWDAAEHLTPYATAYRYPDPIDEPTPEQVEKALHDAVSIYEQALAYLPAEVHPETTETDAG